MNHRPFYEISYATVGSKKFTWAWRMGLLNEEMPFFHPVELERRRRFAAVNPCAPGIHAEGGQAWPDFLGHGGGGPHFFVSERVLNSMKAADLPITRATFIPVATLKCRSKKLNAAPVPRYFVIETKPGIDVDCEESGIPTDDHGMPILKPYPKPWPPVIRLNAASWNHEDLFSFGNIWGPPFTRLLCTERVMEIGEREAWTNCRFTPIQSV